MLAFTAVMTKPPTKYWPLRPLDVTWYRGPARIDGEDLVVDRARVTMYYPMAEPGMGMELARVRTPDDAVAFVSRFGLLNKHLSWQDPFEPLREPLAFLENDAEELRDILEMARLVRCCGDGDGDPDAIRQLRQRVFISEDRDIYFQDETTGESGIRRAGDVYSPEERFEGADNRTILMHAHEYYVARPLTEGIGASVPCAYDRAFMGESVPPGTLRLGVRPNSLAGVCYLSVALALADRVPVAVCADATCGRPFFIADKRQRFCSRACGNRVRLRRFMDKHRTATTPKEDD